MIGNLIGGIGLFLLGMWLMTDGMKTAAGPALERILANATRTRWRGLASGMLVTGVVQSSSAVTMAAIGFVNAGLLTLGQAVWVLFGANLGTTMTGWLVAAAGLGFKVEAAAVPLIGLGMLLHLTGRGRRRAAVGLTLAGFGLLFLGIDILKTSFTGMASELSLPSSKGPLGILMHVLAGLLLTILMQSSSAALAVALTAAQGGLLPLEAAAAVVIGANLGTTSTAVIASVGATVNARRAAGAHVLFNVLTATVALLILPWLLHSVVWLRSVALADQAPGITLALFHTAFNLLGVLLMIPLAARLTAFLELHIGSAQDDQARPQYLDRNLLSVPELAVMALGREMERLGTMSVALLRSAALAQDPAQLAPRRVTVETLRTAIARFVTELNRTGMSTPVSTRLAWLLRVLRYYGHAATLAQASAEVRPARTPDPEAARRQRAWMERVATLCQADASGAGPSLVALEAGLAAAEAHYERLKVDLLQAGAEGRLDFNAMEAMLEAISLMRRSLQQIVKAARVMDNLGAPAEELLSAEAGVPE